jgi:hypothetical protein
MERLEQEQRHRDKTEFGVFWGTVNWPNWLRQRDLLMKEMKLNLDSYREIFADFTCKSVISKV